MFYNYVYVLTRIREFYNVNSLLIYVEQKPRRHNDEYIKITFITTTPQGKRGMSKPTIAPKLLKNIIRKLMSRITNQKRGRITNQKGGRIINQKGGWITNQKGGWITTIGDWDREEHC